jgi:hypothetical protein
VSEKKVVRIFGPKREEVARGWRRLHNEELHNLHASPDTIKGDEGKVDEMGGNVACMGEVRNSLKYLSENLKGRNKAQDLGVDGKIILEWILGKLVGKLWTGLRIGTSGVRL